MPKVSILLLVYNHAKFLRDCLDSILAQKTDFKFEVIIGDDCSDDGSSDIVREYAAKFPAIFSTFIHQVRLGGAGVPNIVSIFSEIKGEYFLLFEGDDLYTDPLKLQRQVDFLEANPEFSVCFHNARVFYDDNSSPAYLLNEGIDKTEFTVSDLIGEQEIWFMATASVMFRFSTYPKVLPEWFKKSKSGDIPLHFLGAKNGKIKYLDFVMSAYRKHAAGTSFSDKYDDAVFIQNRIEMYEGIDGYLDHQFHKRFKKLYAWYYWFMIESRQYKNTYFKRLGIVFRYLSLAGFPKEQTKYALINYILPTWLSKIYFFLRTGKKLNND